MEVLGRAEIPGTFFIGKRMQWHRTLAGPTLDRAGPCSRSAKLPRMLPVFAICVGASAGALLRWRLGLWLSASGSLLPWGTLAANLLGGYLVGVCVALFQALPHLDPTWRLLLITGFLGGLTTFSSFSAEVVTMLTQQRYALALGTAALHLLGSLLLTMAGMRTMTYVLKLAAAE
jgi:CrcB protein